MAGIGHRGFMGRKKEPPSCSGISYGSYNGTKSVYNDGVNNFLRNPDFSYDNSVTGFTILSMWYLDTSTFVDFGYLLSIKSTLGDIRGILGTSNFTSDAPSGNSGSISIPNTLVPFYIAISYEPDGLGGSTYIVSINGITGHNQFYPNSILGNWNGGSYQFYAFRRNTGGNRAPGYCGFMQIIDQPISELCCNYWTGNSEPRNIVGAFNDIMLLDFESGVLNNGTNDVIQDLSANNYDVILDGYSAAQKDPLNPAYCIKNIP